MPGSRSLQSAGWGSTRPLKVNASKASVSPSLELTETLNTSLDSSYTAGSTRTGDSFVLQIDWSDRDNFQRNDESFVDPYLEGPRFRKPRYQEGSWAETSAPLSRKTETSTSSSQRQKNRFGRGASTSSGTSADWPRSEETWENRHQNGQSQKVPRNLKTPTSRGQFQRDQSSVAGSASSSLVEPHDAKAVLQCQQWNRKLSLLLETRGRDSLAVADAFVQLGQAQIAAYDFLEAVISFQSALRIYKKRNKPVAMAAAYDGLGVAKSLGDTDDASRGISGDMHLHQAVMFLTQAFEIRKRELGVWHVDTVDTMNHLGTAYRLGHNLEEACRCYWEVFWVRKAVYGADHPSVAVVANELGRAFACLGSALDAANFYQIALEIYDKMELPDHNPAMARLLRDMEQLERVERFAEA